MSDVPSRKQDQFIVRFPDGLRDQVKASATENKRSMNAEIVAAIEFYLSWGASGEEVVPQAVIDDIVSKADENQAQLDAQAKILDKMQQEFAEMAQNYEKYLKSDKP
jgi:amino acid permease